MSKPIMQEFEAMSEVRDILLPLSEGARRRVISWLDDYFLYDDSVEEDEAPFVVDDTSTIEQPLEDDAKENEGYATFAEFYAAIDPKTVRQKVATTAWWLEVNEQRESWKTYDISKALKGIGIPVRYLSTTITQEKKKSDPMVEQLSKSGDSMQAHGTYCLTAIGRSYVQGRMA